MQLNLELTERLERLARQSSRSIGDHLNRAICEYLDDIEDYAASVAALKCEEPRVSLEELERELLP